MDMDIGKFISKRLKKKGEQASEPSKLDIVLYFIGFRIMIYCDEFHDFESKLSPIKSKQCLTDIKWFMDRRDASDFERQEIYREFINKILGTSTTPFGTTGKRGRGEEDDPEAKRPKDEDWKIEAKKLDISTGFPKRQEEARRGEDINIFIKYLLKLESDNFRDEQRRKGTASSGRRLAKDDDNIKAVSYTHLTLPTKRIV